MSRPLLFTAAVVTLYIGGFVYDEIGPLIYAVIITFLASVPLLLKISFWKKIIFMVPLLVLRVVGKVFLTVFGKNALSKVLAKYGLLEQRFNRMLDAVEQSKEQSISRWKTMSRPTQAYLVLIFFPVAVALFLLTLVVKIVRLRFLQFIIEKLMHSYLMKSMLSVKVLLADKKQARSESTEPNQASDEAKISADDNVPQKDEKSNLSKHSD